MMRQNDIYENHDCNVELYELKILQSNFIDDIKIIEEEINKLKEFDNIKIETEIDHLPAAFDFHGEFINLVIEIIHSPVVDDLVRLAEIYSFVEIILSIIKKLKKNKKRILINKNLIESIAIAKSKDYIIDAKGKYKVWGPMRSFEVDSEVNGVLELLGTNYDDKFTIVISCEKANKRVIMLWYLFNFDGSILFNWKTQTFKNRIPKFLKP